VTGFWTAWLCGPSAPAKAKVKVDRQAERESPGAYWFGESSSQDFLRWFIQIEHWAAKERSSLRPSHEWVKTFPFSGLESQFAALAGDPTPSVGTICAYWIGRTKSGDDLPLVRELARDQDAGVCAETVSALAGFPRLEALALLRELAKDMDSDVRAATMKALKRFLRTENLSVLHELALAPDNSGSDRDPGARPLKSG
jgi:HEAT repeat protein